MESDADTLLIVENDTLLLAQLRRAMEARGFAVRTVSTESDAIELAYEFAPRYALVDLRLEPGDGLAVLTPDTSDLVRARSAGRSSAPLWSAIRC